MGYVASKQRIVHSADAEMKELHALCAIVSAAKHSAIELMRSYPEHRIMCEAIADFATDGESDIRGAIAKLDEEIAREA